MGYVFLGILTMTYFRSVESLAIFLDKFRGVNFLKFQSNEQNRFSKAVLECDNQVLSIGERKLPIGIRFSSGPSSYCFDYEFVDYVVNSKDAYLEELKDFYKYYMRPLEVIYNPN